MSEPNQDSTTQITLEKIFYALVRADVSSSAYRRDDFSAFSWRDHVLCLAHHAHLIRKASCEDTADNFSDHLPLLFSVALAPPSSLSSDSAFAHNNTGSISSSTASKSFVAYDLDKAYLQLTVTIYVL